MRRFFASTTCAEMEPAVGRTGHGDGHVDDTIRTGWGRDAETARITGRTRDGLSTSIELKGHKTTGYQVKEYQAKGHQTKGLGQDVLDGNV